MQSVDTNVFVLPSGQSISEGIDIAAGDTNTPPAERRIRWVRTTDGAVVADIQSYEVGGIDSIGNVAYAGAGAAASFIAASGGDPTDPASTTSLKAQFGPLLSDTGIVANVITGTVLPKSLERVIARTATPANNKALESDYLVNARGPNGTADNKQLSMYPISGVTPGLPAVAAGGTAQIAITGLPFNGKTPVYVTGSMTLGGSVFFGDINIKGFYNFGVNTFSIDIFSGIAFGAGWTIAYNALVFFNS